MSMLSPAAAALVRLMGDMPRGPRRDGLFALWLLLRVVEDLLLVPPPPERGTKRRVAALEQRISSLALPAPLRRALLTAIAGLHNDPVPPGGQVLTLLVAPTRDTLGPEAAEVVMLAAKSANRSKG